MQYRQAMCGSGGSRPAVSASQPLPLPLISPSSPLPHLSSSPPFPPYFPSPNPARGSREHCKLPQQGPGRSLDHKCIFSMFWGTETCLSVTTLLLFVRTKCQRKLKNARIQLWFCRIVTVQKTYNTKLLTCFLYTVKPFIYHMAPIFINSQSTI